MVDVGEGILGWPPGIATEGFSGFGDFGSLGIGTFGSNVGDPTGDSTSAIVSSTVLKLCSKPKK